MSYDNPIYTSYQVPMTANQVDIARKIKGLEGKQGCLMDVMYSPTDTTVGTLTIKVGTATDDDAHGTLTVGNGLAAGTVKRASADGSVVKTAAGMIAADADVVLSLATAADTDDFAGNAVFTFAWF